MISKYFIFELCKIAKKEIAKKESFESPYDAYCYVFDWLLTCYPEIYCSELCTVVHDQNILDNFVKHFDNRRNFPIEVVERI